MKAKAGILLSVLAMGLALAYGPRAGALPIGAQAGVGAPRAGVATGLPHSLHDEAARLLGLNGDELLVLRRSGQSLLEIAKERGLDIPWLQAKLAQARNAAIDQAVGAGTISEAQGAMMKARTQAAIQAMLERQAGPALGQPRGQGLGAKVGAGAPGGRGPRWNRGR